MMTKESTTASPGNAAGGIAGWVWLIALLAISVEAYIPVGFVDESRIRLGLVVFTPLMSAVVAYRYGTRVFGLLAILAIPAMFTLSVDLTDSLSIAFYIPSWVFLLSVVTAVVFCQPAVSYIPRSLLSPRWRWSRWITVAFIFLWAIDVAEFTVDISDSLSIVLALDALLFFASIAIALNYKALRKALRGTVFSGGGTQAGMLKTAVLALLILAVVVSVQWDFFDYISQLYFGSGGLWGFVCIAVFVAIVFRLADWRIVAAVFAMLVFVSEEWGYIYEKLESLLRAIMPSDTSAPPDVHDGILVTGSRVSDYRFGTLAQGAVFVLLGLVFAPIFHGPSISLLKSRRSIALLSFLVAGLLVTTVLWTGYLSDVGLLAVTVFSLAIGYRWGLKGTVFAPLVLQTGFLLACVLLSEELSNLTFYLTQFAFLGFAAAFFGCLLNRVGESRWDDDSGSFAR